MSKTVINADEVTSLKCKCLNYQASDPGSCVFFAHLFTIFQVIVSVFKVALLQISPNLNHTNKTPVNIYVAVFKQPFQNNCIILMLHIIPNRKLHTISFQAAYKLVSVYGQSIKFSKNWPWPLY